MSMTHRHYLRFYSGSGCGSSEEAWLVSKLGDPNPDWYHPPPDKMTAADLGIVDTTPAPSKWRSLASAPVNGMPVLLFARSKQATAPVILVGWYTLDHGWIEAAFAPNSPVGVVPYCWQPLPEFPVYDPDCTGTVWR